MGETDPMAEHSPGEVYRATRDRIIGLVTGHGEQGARTTVPACPAWTVQDTIAHVVGIVDDLHAGRTEGLGSEAWTAAQVDARRGRTLAEVCAEWEGQDGIIAALMASDPWLTTRIVADLVTHEHDVRAALNEPGARDDAAVHVGLQRYAPAFIERAETAGLAAVAVHAGPLQWSPSGDATVELHGTPFEVLRALTGRRSQAQVQRLDWRGGDPAPYLPLISPYGQPSEDVVE